MMIKTYRYLLVSYNGLLCVRTWGRFPVLADNLRFQYLAQAWSNHGELKWHSVFKVKQAVVMDDGSHPEGRGHIQPLKELFTF
jgi:hypothetical protein